jgi:3-phosphoshikimate 1-carboxyvinyltransferase
MFTPITALHDKEIVINGKGSVLSRPVKMVELPLIQLGVEVSSTNGYLPIRVKGPLTGGSVTADGSVSSQFITGLLMALPVAAKDSRITVKNLVSRPYIDLTISILAGFGIEIVNDDYTLFGIKGNQVYRPGEYTVEGDWSGAAFLMVMGAIGGQIEIRGLDPESTQADREIYNAMSLAGANINRTGSSIIVSGGDLKGFEFDISDCPDLAPPLAALALACRGKTVLTGTRRLLSKESNRSHALKETLSSLGARINNFDDRMEIEGGYPLKGGIVDSFNDHRIAMTLAVAGLLCVEPVIISEMESVNKSYPGFINDFSLLGGNISII